MKTVFICSPLRPKDGRTFEQNQDLCRRLCAAATRAGVAPFAPHIFYTQFLDDAVEAERNAGMSAGSMWLAKADEVWVYDRLGISSGMAQEIGAAEMMDKDVVVSPLAFAEVSP